MQIGIVGINYRSADLQERENLTQIIQSHFSVDRDFLPSSSIVILHTCNRMEIYFSGVDLALLHAKLMSFLKKHTKQCFEPFLYSYFGYVCFYHLCKVCAGLDSVLFGESEIQHQVKQCYLAASSAYSLDSCMHYAFQRAMQIGKLIRTQFGLPRKQACLEGAVEELVVDFVKKTSSPSLLFIGNSEINRKVMLHLKRRGFPRITLATRSPSAALSFCQKNKMHLLAAERLSLWIEYDVVISATNHKQYVLKHADALDFVEPARIIPTSLLIDLSMPRSIDPSLSHHPQITLFNMEEMNHLLQKKSLSHFQQGHLIFSFLEDAVQQNIARFEKKQKERAFCTALC